VEVTPGLRENVELGVQGLCTLKPIKYGDGATKSYSNLSLSLEAL